MTDFHQDAIAAACFIAATNNLLRNKLYNLENNAIFTTIYNRKIKKNKNSSNDQSELTVDTRAGKKIGHVLNWYQNNSIPNRMTHATVPFFWNNFLGRVL